MPELDPSEERLWKSIRSGATCTQRSWKQKGDNSICFVLLYGVRKAQGIWTERKKGKIRKGTIRASVVKRGFHFRLPLAAMEGRILRVWK
jgi:hypothetical protein